MAPTESLPAALNIPSSDSLSPLASIFRLLLVMHHNSGPPLWPPGSHVAPAEGILASMSAPKLAAGVRELRVWEEVVASLGKALTGWCHSGEFLVPQVWPRHLK